MNKQLWTQLLEAAEVCNHTTEEQGGLILRKDEDYLFVPIKNIYAGTYTSIGLYETDKIELKMKVFTRMSEGWRMFASFHTHPMFSATPSVTDMSYLFQGFESNYIYAPKPRVFSATIWEGDTSKTTFIPKEEIKEKLQHI
jgi:proteasome lid subunit RPN8/RPN11